MIETQESKLKSYHWSLLRYHQALWVDDNIIHLNPRKRQVGIEPPTLVSEYQNYCAGTYCCGKWENKVLYKVPFQPIFLKGEFEPGTSSEIPWYKTVALVKRVLNLKFRCRI